MVLAVMAIRRTVLLIKGKMADSRVEVMDPLALGMLADEFIAKL